MLFYNFDKRNSSYYINRWPSSDISVLIVKSFIFNSGSHYIFMENYYYQYYNSSLLPNYPTFKNIESFMVSEG